MDGRREPRFQIYASAKLSMLDGLERELECLLLDISATGLKFVADEKLPVDEVVALEVEDHLVLADVRYSEQRGDRFVMGAERIHAMEKAALPQDKTKPEQIRFIVDDYKNRIRAVLVTAQPSSPPPQVTEQLGQYRDQIVEAAVQKLLDQWAQERAVSQKKDRGEEGQEQEVLLRAAIIERAQGRVPRPTPAEAPMPVEPLTAPPVAIPAPITTPIEPPVGSRWKSPAWRMRIATAGAIAMLGFTGSIFWSYRRSAAANVLQPAASVSRPTVTATPGREPAPEATSHAATLSRTPAVSAARTSSAEIRVTEPVWVYAVSDGKEVLQKLLAKDETRQIDFAEKAVVRVGNAGGVEISVDGKPIGPLGPSGKIRAVELTASGHRFVPLSEAEPGRN